MKILLKEKRYRKSLAELEEEVGQIEEEIEQLEKEVEQFAKEWGFNYGFSSMEEKENDK